MRNTYACNCENGACSHEPAGCTKIANQGKRLQYVGAVCFECWFNADPQYRLNHNAKETK
jgi:hypothetical protein